jgi:hypothetical protein
MPTFCPDIPQKSRDTTCDSLIQRVKALLLTTWPERQDLDAQFMLLYRLLLQGTKVNIQLVSWFVSGTRPKKDSGRIHRIMHGICNHNPRIIFESDPPASAWEVRICLTLCIPFVFEASF